MFEYNKVEKENVDILKKKVEKLNRKAKKIGVSPLSIVVSEPYKIFRQNEINIVYAIEVYDVVINGELPKYGNWVFVATIQGYPDGQNMVYKTPHLDENLISAEQLEKYRSEKSYCDHCNTKRYRKNTYLVFNTETKEIKQIGSTCIKDFLGHPAPSFPFFSGLLNDLLDPDFKEVVTGTRFYRLDDYLPLAVAVIKRDGFISRKKADQYDTYATVDFVNNLFNNPKLIHNEKLEITKENIKLVDKIIEWGKSLKDRKHLNDYLYNLSVVFNNDLFEFRAAGLIVASVFTYLNEMGEIEKNKIEKKSNEHFGDIKKRYELKLKIVKVLPFDGDFGPTYMHSFVDELGNSFVWWGSYDFTQRNSIENYDEFYNVKATVKAHKEYKGRKQTVITRVSY